MGDDEKVVYLAFSNPALSGEEITLMGCTVCHNKTFKVLHPDPELFPAMHCAACDAFLGYFGWADNDHVD